MLFLAAVKSCRGEPATAVETSEKYRRRPTTGGRKWRVEAMARSFKIADG
jgi:hypothetical protein